MLTTETVSGVMKRLALAFNMKIQRADNECGDMLRKAGMTDQNAYAVLDGFCTLWGETEKRKPCLNDLCRHARAERGFGHGVPLARGSRSRWAEWDAAHNVPADDRDQAYKVPLGDPRALAHLGRMRQKLTPLIGAWRVPESVPRSRRDAPARTIIVQDDPGKRQRLAEQSKVILADKWCEVLDVPEDQVPF